MPNRAHITLVDGLETSAIQIADRGLAYGDGLFETMRVDETGKVPLLKFHLNRFEKGVKALGLGSRKALSARFKSELSRVLDEISGAALVKLIVTRGQGGRGYAPAEDHECTFISQAFALPELPTMDLHLFSCTYTLPDNPHLAGIKHLNRLDQVMAARELRAIVSDHKRKVLEHSEGLLFGADKRLIEGTKSNVIIELDDKLITPRLDRAGVSGTLREYILSPSMQSSHPIEELDIMPDFLARADAVAVFNSVMGIGIGSTLDGRAIKPGALLSKLQNTVHRKLGYD